ncbi:MAG TPA: pyrroline-5-carboxylate reductase [Candidatus Thermoplasmatota archaeon]|nr:pyrroline-5-carboxylate reductase [Candidatus Thermoplasmatota archaeon]
MGRRIAAGDSATPRRRIAVLGAGNMGTALLRGMLKAKVAAREDLAATTRDPRKAADLAKDLGIDAHVDNRKAAKWADVVVLGVKPQILPRLLDEVKGSVRPGALVVSIAAGVPTTAIEAALPKAAVVRTMPNLAVMVDAGATALCLGRSAGPGHAALAREMFESVGLVVEVDEYLMDAVTGLSGTGPMYVFQIIEGLSDAGVKVGLSRDVANQLVVQTVLGAAKMAQQSTEHPARLKDRVTSPGGTAITALHTMERGGLRAILIDAVEAATKRSEELGRKAGGGRSP